MDIQPVSPGMYSMDGNNYDLGTLLMAIGMERAENIESQVLDQANAMKERNKKLEKYSQVLATLRSGEGNVTLSKEERAFLEETGDWPLGKDDMADGDDELLSKADKEAGIEEIKGKMDSLNSDSQMDMIRLQGLMSKRDTVYQSITNLMKKDEGSKNTIVANYR